MSDRTPERRPTTGWDVAALAVVGLVLVAVLWVLFR